jgi:hypothetical protein
MTEAGAISTPICMMTRKVDDDWNAGKEASLGVCGVLFLPAEQTRTAAASSTM